MVVMGQYAVELDRTTEADVSGTARRFATGGRARAGSSAQRRSILTQTVEFDVIPRLLLAHRKVAPQPLQTERLAAPRLVTAEEIDTLTALSLGSEELAMLEFVAVLQAQGFAVESINLDLLAPVARRLGIMWDQDLCDFTEVTIGLWRLQSVMRRIGPAVPERSRGRAAPRALLVPLPGEQHTFGLAMVVDSFRRAGWNAWSGPVKDRGELANMVRSEWIDVVGFSLACDERLETARAEIKAVRAASCNPGLAVMVGGPPFLAAPEMARAIGADGTASDASMAVAEAGALLRREAERR